MSKLINKSFLGFFVLYSLFFAFVSFFYLQKISAFGCFDDCNNFLGGYFLLSGKQIFSEFFFNHAPGMAYLSYAVQLISHPDSIYNLILFHRLSLFAFSFFAGLFLIYRFKLIGFLFLIVYESTKYYIFGDRFLAESFIVYPLVYLAGLVFLRLTESKLKNYDYLLSALFSWLIVFTREPYIPLVFLLLFLIFAGRLNRIKVLSISTFICLSLGVLIVLPVKELIENVFIYNSGITSSEIAEKGGALRVLITAFLYPIYVFVNGVPSIFRLIEQALSLMFLLVVFKALLVRKYKLVIAILLVLCVSNIRFVMPGEMFYGSFHMVIWYALLVFSTIFLFFDLKLKKKYAFIFVSVLFLISIFSLTSKESFTNTSLNRNQEFLLSYNDYYVYGSFIKALSEPSDTVFLEERDDLIYYVTGLGSAYKYQWYTSLMPTVEKYKKAREEMFKKYPPDFYYDSCILKQRKQKDPENYVRVKLNGKPSCLLIKQSKFNSIPKEKWERVSPLGLVP